MHQTISSFVRISIVWIVFLFQTKAQTFSYETKAVLPNCLNESSGIVVVNDSTFWSHDDSGNSSELFKIDANGHLLRRIYIKNASNIDWEELRNGNDGYYYIGDFGNNNNDRKNLRILRIPNPETHANDSIDAEFIQFVYPDQTAFPPVDAAKNFDMEAMILLNQSIYLFSKNRTNPYTGYTFVYKLPTTPGTYIAAKIDSFYTGSGSYLESSVTSAAISPNHQSLFLLGYQKYWLIQGFKGDAFFKGKIHAYNWDVVTQKEGVDFLNDSVVYLTDELFLGVGGKLYKGVFHTGTTGGIRKSNGIEFSVSPNPFVDQLTIHFSQPIMFGKLSLFNASGDKIREENLRNVSKCKWEELENLPEGIYTLVWEQAQGRVSRKVLHRK